MIYTVNITCYIFPLVFKICYRFLYRNFTDNHWTSLGLPQTQQGISSTQWSEPQRRILVQALESFARRLILSLSTADHVLIQYNLPDFLPLLLQPPSAHLFDFQMLFVVWQRLDKYPYTIYHI